MLTVEGREGTAVFAVAVRTIGAPTLSQAPKEMRSLFEFSFRTWVFYLSKRCKHHFLKYDDILFSKFRQISKKIHQNRCDAPFSLLPFSAALVSFLLPGTFPVFLVSAPVCACFLLAHAPRPCPPSLLSLFLSRSLRPSPSWLRATAIWPLIELRTPIAHFALHFSPTSSLGLFGEFLSNECARKSLKSENSQFKKKYLSFLFC